MYLNSTQKNRKLVISALGNNTAPLRQKRLLSWLSVLCGGIISDGDFCFLEKGFKEFKKIYEKLFKSLESKFYIPNQKNFMFFL